MSYLIIINPHAGNKQQKPIVKKLITMLEENEFSYTIKQTTKKDDALNFAKSAIEKNIIVLGGDGTVNEVINGIMFNKKNKPRMAIIPIGTSNMLARSLNISKEINKAISIIKENRRRDLDLGFIVDKKRYFAIACGIGIEAAAYENVEPKIKKLFGEIAYPLSFIKTIFNYEPKELTIEINGKTEKAYYILVLNTVKLTNFLEFVKQSSSHDGYLDVLLFTKKDIISQFKYLLGVITKQHTKFNDIKIMKTKKLQITAGEQVILHADAEIIGTTPVKIEIVPSAIEVIC